MATTVIMPKLGLTMTEGTIERWLKKEGDRVQKGEPLVEIITEKINFQYESPASGILRKILCHEGEIVPVATPIAIIAEEGEALPELEGVMPEVYAKPIAPSIVNKETKVEAPKRILASPLAKRIAKEKGIDLRTLQGSGPRGRIVQSDVLKAIERLKEREIPIPPPSEKLIPLRGIRKVIAKRMTESFQTIPHFYLSIEVEMTALQELRERIKEEIERRLKIRITMTDLLVKVIASVLKAHPVMNSKFEEDQIHLMEEINIGVAIALEEGLIVPVIHQADKKSLSEISLSLRNLTQRAREGKLTLEDVKGGTFTLSNMGMLEIDQFNPIINPPQCSILGVGRTVEKPIVKGKEIVIKPMAWLTLSSDHRIVDGATAAQFLKDLKRLMEDPLLLLI
ncbi:MAG: dihydrolipoamide acetyltransferase family protein [Thermodesulfobacteriota bacterium]